MGLNRELGLGTLRMIYEAGGLPRAVLASRALASR
jgi:hypothetical protein